MRLYFKVGYFLLQVSVTGTKLGYRSKFNLKSIIATILVFLTAFISIIILINVKKKSLVFEQQYFYFVCADSSKKVSVLDNQKDYLKSIGGASVTYYHLNNYYLVANVYLNIDDANEIKKNLSNNFTNASVLTVKSAKLSKDIKNKIKQDMNVLKFYKFLYNFNKEFQVLIMDYFSGELLETNFVSDLIAKNLKFAEFRDNIKGDSKLEGVAREFAGLFALQFSSFLNNFYIAKSKQNYVSAYYVGFVINYLEFYKSL